MTSTFFGHIQRKRPPALVYKFLRDLESGLFETPKSFDVFSRYRTEELKLDKGGHALRVRFPENRLISAFVKKYPQARSQAIALSSFEPPLAKEFALRQLQLMTRDGLLGNEAFARVEQEMMPKILALTERAMGSSVSQVMLAQREEEEQLQSGMEAVAEGKLAVQEARQRGGPASASLKITQEERRRKNKEEYALKLRGGV